VSEFYQSIASSTICNQTMDTSVDACIMTTVKDLSQMYTSLINSRIQEAQQSNTSNNNELGLLNKTNEFISPLNLKSNNNINKSNNTTHNNVKHESKRSAFEDFEYDHNNNNNHMSLDTSGSMINKHYLTHSTSNTIVLESPSMYSPSRIIKVTPSHSVEKPSVIIDINEEGQTNPFTCERKALRGPSPVHVYTPVPTVVPSNDNNSSNNEYTSTTKPSLTEEQKE
jgi:hypothetical protein